LHQTGVFSVGQLNGVIPIFARPTLVAMGTKIANFQQEIGISDITKILAPNRGFLGQPI